MKDLRCIFDRHHFKVIHWLRVPEEEIMRAIGWWCDRCHHVIVSETMSLNGESRTVYSER